MEQWRTVDKINPVHQIEGGRWVEIIARIHNNLTCETRDYHTDAILMDGEEEPNTYIWEEGNFACDCNRHDFFQDADNEDRTEGTCSDDKYTVALINPVNNRVFYDENE
jgi:hypothetical protein